MDELAKLSPSQGGDGSSNLPGATNGLMDEQVKLPPFHGGDSGFKSRSGHF